MKTLIAPGNHRIDAFIFHFDVAFEPEKALAEPVTGQPGKTQRTGITRMKYLRRPERVERLHSDLYRG